MITIDSSIVTAKGIIIQGCNSGTEGVVWVDAVEVEKAPSIMNDWLMECALSSAQYWSVSCQT